MLPWGAHIIGLVLMVLSLQVVFFSAAKYFDSTLAGLIALIILFVPCFIVSHGIAKMILEKMSGDHEQQLPEMQNLDNQPEADFQEKIFIEPHPMPQNRKIVNFAEKNLKNLKQVGFWRSGEQPHLPRPEKYVDHTWDPEERKWVISYFDACYFTPYFQAGVSWCRMGCADIPADIGSQNLTDGTWIFPEGLVHYLIHHNVKPPSKFLHHIRNMNYQVPVLPELRAHA